MADYQKILVVIDVKKSKQESIKRAIALAKCRRAHITLFFPLSDNTIDRTITNRTLTRQQWITYYYRWLKVLKHDYIDNSLVHIDIKVSWHYNLYQAIVEEMINGRYALIIKACQTPTHTLSLDWQLLRSCPCPIWLVKEQPWPDNVNIVVAANLLSHDPNYIQLNTNAMQAAILLSNRFNGATLHLVASYDEATDLLMMELSGIDTVQYNTMIRHHFLLAMKALRQKYAIAQEQTHLAIGTAEQALSRIARQVNANVMIVGCCGRTHLPAFLLGNTAEQLTKDLPCDLFAVKLD